MDWRAETESSGEGHLGAHSLVYIEPESELYDIISKIVRKKLHGDHRGRIGWLRHRSKLQCMY